MMKSVSHLLRRNFHAKRPRPVAATLLLREQECKNLGRERWFSSDCIKNDKVIVEQHRKNQEQQSTKHNVHEDATALVDGLLARTRALMDSVHTANHHVVAFSGGIDSSLVLALLWQCSKNEKETVQAVLGRSPAVPKDQVQLAQTVANHIGVELQQVETNEGSDETYIANNGQACFACKTHLYSALTAVAQHAATRNYGTRSPTTTSKNNNNDQNHILYNGTNADDTHDTTRVGLIAAHNFQVQSPLLYTTKAEVRRAAKHLGLPNWNVAASPCLRSRLALGVEATQTHLQRIEAAEHFVKQQLAGHLSETTNLRVRLLSQNRAMLEIDAALLPLVETHLLHNHSHVDKNPWQGYFVKTLGFNSIQARAFRSGSVAAQPPSQPPRLDSLREAVA